MSTRSSRLLLVFLFLGTVAFAPRPATRPALYLVGDSTVKNGKGRGDGGLWGWGNYLPAYLDTTRLRVENDALGGTSSRTFQTQGWWEKVQAKLRPGDFVLIQFGHNDNGPLADTARARGTIKGVGEESEEVYNPLMKKQEVVHTYGWYLRRLVAEARAKGATPIICSPIPRNTWTNGRVNRNNADYGQWAAEVARQTDAYFIDLNRLVADKYDQAGEATVRATYFNSTDHTHTIEAGARLNAQAVAAGLRTLPGKPLKKYLRK